MTAMAIRNVSGVAPVLAASLDQKKSLWWDYGVMAFCVLHIPLALLLAKSATLSTVHGVVAFAIGVWMALTSTKRPERVAYAAAYMVGSEVLWRMTHSQVFWEFGKYSVAAIFLVAIFRSHRLKGPALVFGYFALLIPSIGFLMMRTGLLGARSYVSAFLSGPLALMASAWFFSRIKLTMEELQRIFLVAIGPIIGIATVTFFGIYSAKEISFTGSSNFATSGGFGPNQVSSALGLGALFALLLLLLSKRNQTLKIFLLLAMLLLAVQSALTFSRGGLYNVGGAIAIASVYFLRDSRTRRTLFFLVVTIVLVGSFVILPRLDKFTGGALEARFANTNTTNRSDIALEELYLFLNYPVLGVGPGGSKFAHVSTAHTEFARMPAEHGIPGLISLILLLIAAAEAIKKAKSSKSKAIAVSLVVWSFLYMLNAAMRLVAPSFVFGLAFATILPEATPRLALLYAILRHKLQARLGARRRPWSSAAGFSQIR
jgi:O-antigen ligase